MEETLQSPSPEIKARIVRAGAGAGKTTRLIQRVFEESKEFYSKHQRWPQLVVTTFTVKATQELRERLLKKAISEQDSEFLKFVSNPQSLQITTLHGIFYIFLRRHAHQLGLDAQLAIGSGEDRFKNSTQVLRSFIFEDQGAQALIERYGFHQLRRKAMAYYSHWLEHDHLEPCNIKDFESLYLEHMKLWSRTMSECSAMILETVEHPKWVEYAHKLQTLALRMKDEGEVLSGEEWVDELKALGSKPRKSKDIDEQTSEVLTQALNDFKKQMIKEAYQPENWSIYAEDYQAFARVAREFSQRFFDDKVETAKIGMDDIELLTFKFIKEKPQIAKIFAEQWDYWLIDEYQDTSPIQIKILQELIGDRRYFLVGDPQQSIYLFRGARSEVFSEKQKSIEASLEGQVDHLNRNYRSEPELLEFTNSLFTPMSDEFSGMVPRTEDKFQLNAPCSTVTLLAEEPVNAAEKREVEQHAVVERVKTLHEEGVAWKDICVLTRTNQASIDFSRAMMLAGIPSKVHSSTGFYLRPEVQDALAFLRFLLSPYDNGNLIQLLRSPWFHVTDRELVAQLGERPKHFWQHLSENCGFESVVRLKSFLEKSKELGLIEAFEEGLLSSGLFEACRVDDPTGRKEANLWKLITDLRMQERAPGFNPLNYYLRIQRGLKLGWLEDESDAIGAFEPDSVNLMTVHASKGLEFPHVIVPGLHKATRLSRSGFENSFFNFDEQRGKWSFAVPMGSEGKAVPSLLDMECLRQKEERELRESLRVFYVAVTRAEKSLHLIANKKFEKNSWASHLKIDLSAGDHVKEKYVYRVIDQESATEKERATPAPMRSALPAGHIEGQSAREAWEEVAKESAAERWSVSRFLQERKSSLAPVSNSGVKDVFATLKTTYNGTMLHKIFECLHYQSDFDIETFCRQWVDESQVEQFVEAVNFVMGQASPPMSHLLECGNVEWGFQVKIPGGILEGQVDLWGMDPDQPDVAWVVDYKTGQSSYLRGAFDQLKLYSMALQEVFGFKWVKVCVMNPIIQKVEVQDSPSAGEIRKSFAIEI